MKVPLEDGGNINDEEGLGVVIGVHFATEVQVGVSARPPMTVHAWQLLV